MKMRDKLLFICLLSFLYSCKKDQYKCIDLEYDVSHSGLQVIGNRYQGFSFNPANNAEFCGYRVGPTGYELYRYNLHSLQFEVIADANAFYGDVHWGRNGWLLLSGRDWNIYKIKPDGDSLTQLTYTGNCISTSWNYDASQVIYFNNEINRPMILDTQTGESLAIEDDFPSASADWSSFPDLILGKTQTYFYRYRPSDGSIEKCYSDTKDYQGPYAYINTNTSVLLKMNEGTYIFDWNTKEYTLLRSECDNRRYHTPKFNKIENRIYMVRIEMANEKGDLYSLRSRIVSMNIDGSDERVIELP